MIKVWRIRFPLSNVKDIYYVYKTFSEAYEAAKHWTIKGAVVEIY